ncbi:MAG: ABC transporter ATP-binding protein [Deltaproteobacteria bacterium]|nr:ABC transporter ATP-binding protein [Deltaproteobacteria bacterium]
MSSDPVIRLNNLGKCYHLYDKPRDRLLQMLSWGRRRYYREFWALRDVSLEIGRGDVVGIIGCNGAGKSTLLQLVCGTLNPTHGEINVHGRVAALLELGAGFNPEFTGRENVVMSAAVMGLSSDEVEARLEEIIDFSGIRSFIDQPVKTYSSGMYVRLAFSVATSVDPDILVIDEALSVGDGAFARKSFERIMALKDRGATILFCSHAMYHVDALCERALWLDRGEVRMFDSAQKVTAAYNAFLARENPPTVGQDTPAPASVAAVGTARILRVSTRCDGIEGRRLTVVSRNSTVELSVEFASDPILPCPSVALGIENDAGVGVTSAIGFGETGAVKRTPDGAGCATVIFPEIPLLKGRYHVTVFLACERGLHVYDSAPRCLTLEVTQEDALQGVVVLPHQWELRA